MNWSSKVLYVCSFNDVIGAGAGNSFTPLIQCHNDNVTRNQNKHQSDLYAKNEYIRRNGLAFVFEIWMDVFRLKLTPVKIKNFHSEMSMWQWMQTTRRTSKFERNLWKEQIERKKMYVIRL